MIDLGNLRKRFSGDQNNEEATQKKIGDFWSKKHLSPVREKIRWWQHQRILRHINKRVCGEPLAGAGAGMRKKLREQLGDRVLEKGISVGCGEGIKEMRLLQEGFVKKFELYELSEVRIEKGRKIAQDRGLADRVQFHLADAFKSDAPQDFDLVYWDNSLHHMFDTPAAVQWSYERLKLDGFFVMDDFVGPSHFQWTDLNLRVASQVRSILPSYYLDNPRNPGKQLPTTLGRPNLEKFLAIDPSEAADSSRILEAVTRWFPDAEITLTGGCIYHVGLNDVLGNIDDDEDSNLLDMLLLVDDLCVELGETHYAVAIAKK